MEKEIRMVRMSKDSIMKSLAIVVICLATVNFIYSVKTVASIIVFIGFGLSSAEWIISFLKGTLKAHTWYLFGMGLMLFFCYDLITKSLVLALLGTILFIIYTAGFIATFDFKSLKNVVRSLLCQNKQDRKKKLGW